MSAPVLELLPAVDISEGYAVRPVGGTLSGGEQRLDPVEAALTWVKSGARWIHLVDLDLAFGRGTNTEVLAEVVAAVRAESARSSAPVRIQVSGGVRNAESLERALSLSPDRVNVTSAALADSSWLESTLARYADSDLLALGLDARYNPERVSLFTKMSSTIAKLTPPNIQKHLFNSFNFPSILYFHNAVKSKIINILPINTA